MKKIAFVICCCVFSFASIRASAQEEELEQLVLDLEKLAQFKQILSDLKKGYAILLGGYTTIKDIAKGDFSLHKAFLDGLLDVSPAVRNYKRIYDIVDYQLRLIKEYKIAVNRFRNSDLLSDGELAYIGSVYSNLADQSLQNIDALAMVITAGKTRMSDDERIHAIDEIFRDMEDKLSFLRWFNSTGSVLMIQRAKEKNDRVVLKELYGF